MSKEFFEKYLLANTSDSMGPIFFCLFFFFDIGGASWWRVCYQQGLPCQVFIESAHWANLVIESQCPSVCLSVCLSVTIQNSHFPVSWRLLVKGCIANVGLR